eukprot:11169294-Lingulodinium_polyedra.AAC.1
MDQGRSARGTRDGTGPRVRTGKRAGCRADRVAEVVAVPAGRARRAAAVPQGRVAGLVAAQ